LNTNNQQLDGGKDDERSAALKALPQPLHLYEFLTGSHHYHFGCFQDPGEPIVRAMDRLVFRFMPLLVPGGVTLDVGCGIGGTSSLLAGCGFPTVGIDPAGSSINFAKLTVNSRENPRFAKMNVQDLMQGLSIEPGRFDNIVMIEALQHIPSLEELFLWCFSACRPGGVVVINDVVTIPALQWSKVPFHRRGAVRAAGEAAGLEVVEEQEITSAVIPTLDRLISLLEASQKQVVSFFGGARAKVNDEISELIHQWEQLRTGFINRDLAYETVVLRCGKAPADHG